jgi:hypothetical protein
LFFYAAASFFINTKKPVAAIRDTNANAFANPCAMAGGLHEVEEELKGAKRGYREATA